MRLIKWAGSEVKSGKEAWRAIVGQRCYVKCSLLRWALPSEDVSYVGLGRKEWFLFFEKEQQL